MDRRVHAALAAALTVLAVVAGPAGLALATQAGGDAVTLGTDIPINSDQSVQKYETNGVVSADIAAPRMSVTIASEREQVGLGYTLDPLKGSTRNDFIRITHSEDMRRTVRIPIRSEYWEPFPRDGLESLDENHTATLEPIRQNGKRYTLLSVTFTGAGGVVFPIPEDAVAVYRVSENTESRVNTTFGIDLGLTPSPWSHVEDGVFANETAVRIEGDPETMMIQYNDGTADNPTWLTVPEGERRNVPLYRLQKEGVDGAVYVVSKTNDPPAVRYKTKTTFGDDVSVWYREAKHIPRRISDGIGFNLPSLDLPFMSVSSSGVVA